MTTCGFRGWDGTVGEDAGESGGELEGWVSVDVDVIMGTTLIFEENFPQRS